MAKVIFLQVSVCPQGGRVSASVHAGMPYPPRMENPPRVENPPPRKQTPAYGLRAAGTHPTGMHTCVWILFPDCGTRISSFEFGFQYKRAAAAYDRAGRMSDAVKLHETLRDYRRAIQLLVDNSRFDAAIDVLKRYEIFNKVTVKVHRLIAKPKLLKLQSLCEGIQYEQREEQTNGVIKVEV